MIVIGIDPGYAIVGYGIVEELAGKCRRLTSGCIMTEKSLEIPARLEIIYNDLFKLIKEYQPDALIMEKVFFNKNVNTAIKTGEGRGVIMLAASINGLPVFEFTPLQIKQTVAGFGRASKEQVEKMVMLQLKLTDNFTHDDESDALAVALCYLQQRKHLEALERRSGR